MPASPAVTSQTRHAFLPGSMPLQVGLARGLHLRLVRANGTLALGLLRCGAGCAGHGPAVEVSGRASSKEEASTSRSSARAMTLRSAEFPPQTRRKDCMTNADSRPLSQACSSAPTWTTTTGGHVLPGVRPAGVRTGLLLEARCETHPVSIRHRTPECQATMAASCLAALGWPLLEEAFGRLAAMAEKTVRAGRA